MPLIELHSTQEIKSLLHQNKHTLITFSATWCGPCKASHPTLVTVSDELGTQYNLPVGIVYEHELGDDTQDIFRIKAFPTYVLFEGEKEVDRVEGVNFDAVKKMVTKAGCQKDLGKGYSLGGSGSGSGSGGDARALRLARFGGGDAAAGHDGKKKKKEEDDDVEMKDDAEEKPTAAVDTSKSKQKEEEEDGDVKMSEAKEDESSSPREMIDPTSNLKPEDVETLTGSMGFTKIRAQKGLLHGNGTVEGAVEWLLVHQDDDDIDSPIPLEPQQQTTTKTTTTMAQSYKCNECQKVLSNMANLELHANKTGHADFEESTTTITPLTPQQKAAKIAEIKSLLQTKRRQREADEKAADVDREKQRRFMGKEMAKTKEEMDMLARKREAKMRKKEKEAYKRERERIKLELAKDKAERKANKGKLKSALGVEGYNPNAIQYDKKEEEEDTQKEEVQQEGDDSPKKPKKKPSASPAKMDEYISKISSYRAGGDGGTCLKILKAYIGNIVDKPQETKFRTIKLDNKAYKTKVKPFLGAKSLLMAVGFRMSEDGLCLVLGEDDFDQEVLGTAKGKLEVAYDAYMK